MSHSVMYYARLLLAFPLFAPTAATTIIKTDGSIRGATSATPSRYQVFSNQQWPSCCIRPTAGCVGPPTPTNLTLANLSLPDFKKWRIRTNPGLTFDGSVVATLYSFGLIPSYKGMGPGGGKHRPPLLLSCAGIAAGHLRSVMCAALPPSRFRHSPGTSRHSLQ